MKSQSTGLASFLLLLLTSPQESTAFTASITNSNTKVSSFNANTNKQWKLSSNNNKEEEMEPPQLQINENKNNGPVETFFETTALSGAEKIRKLSVEERTRRAMVAEGIEDRVSNLYDDFESKLENGSNKEELKFIAKQIKVLQIEYSAVVNGDDHMLV